jgi:hypothetical protein
MSPIIIKPDVEVNELFLRESDLIVPCCSAPTGARKTTRLIDRAVDRVRGGERVMYVAPTKALADQTALNIRDSGVKVRVVHEDVQSHPTGWLVDYVRTAEGERPQVICTTHAALPYLRDIDRGDWHLYVDEALQVVRMEEWCLPLTNHLFLEHISDDLSEVRGRFARLRIREGHRPRVEDRTRTGDEMLVVVREGFRLLASDVWDTWASVDGLHKLIAGSREHLTLHSTMRPEVLADWASVLVVGACLEDTAMHRVWSRVGVSFVQDEAFLASLAYAEHPVGPTMSVRYATEVDATKNLLFARRKSLL